MKQYNPYDWYWLADDGRLYSSAVQAVVADDDAAFVQWRDDGIPPTKWPRDKDGLQTYAALQSVVGAYGMFADLKAYAAAKRWEKEVGGITVVGIPVQTDDRSKLMITGARIAANADNTFTTKWVDGNGEVHPINAAQVIGISNAVSAHVGQCFAVYADVISDIDENTITSRAAVDAAFEVD